ncbi:TonB-dependent siderophore receptor [Nitrosomonas sp.]|uniref:TonB-dependent siderophore receptor n=2 Tax=Nitrosomonas sp. TaxID=42353 RepID=UPI0037CB741E
MSGHPFHVASAAAVIVFDLPVRAGMGFRSLLITIHLVVISGLAGWQSMAHAQTIEPAAASMQQTQAARTYNIPAGPLEAALARFISESGVPLAATPELVQGKQSPGVRGTFSIQVALNALLKGTGLEAIRNAEGQYGLQPVASEVRTLPPVTVTSRAINSNSVLGNLPPAYPGGQVATGGRLGLLGNRDMMDAPFSQISYTEELIQNQQAKTVGDVLRNDPSVTLQSSRATGFEEFTIRGFGTLGQDRLSINGLYGTSPIVPMELVERVEILKGPNALLNGLPTSGNAIGGTVNMVLKRAPEDPLTRLTTSYQSRSNFGAHIDVGRRFGEGGKFGARFNGSYRKGETAIKRNKDEFGLVGLGLDFRGERVRLSVDLSYQKADIDAQAPLIRVGVGVPVPSAPNSSKGFSPFWFDRFHEELFGMVQGEVDISSNVTAYVAFGVRDWKLGGRNATPTINNVSGDWLATSSSFGEKYKNLSGQTGIRASFDTGPVSHELVIDVSRATRDYSYANLSGSVIASNIYIEPNIPDPGLPRANPIKRADTVVSSFGFVDTLSILDKRVQLTVGMRRQRLDRGNFNAAGTAVTSNYDRHVWTPAYALLLKPLKNVSVYANYIEGLEQGTTVGETFANAGQIFPPYRTKQYEAGMKVDWGTLTTTVGAFEITRASTISVPGMPFPTLSVDGEQVNRGIEVNVFGEPVNGLRVLGGVMFLDGKLTKTEGGINDGRKAPGVPEINIALGVEWDPSFLPRLTFSGRVNHNGKKFFDAANTQVIPAWTRVDLGTRYKLNTSLNNKAITFRFDVQNVFDRDYWENGMSVLTISAPRTFLLSASMDF